MNFFRVRVVVLVTRRDCKKLSLSEYYFDGY
jgi:hypothetical protein